MLIPATPSFGNKVICRYPGFTFQTFVQQYEYIILSPFGFPFQLSKNCHIQFHRHNFWSQTLPDDFEPFLILPEAYMYQDDGPRPSFHTPRLDAPYLYKLLLLIIIGVSEQSLHFVCAVTFSIFEGENFVLVLSVPRLCLSISLHMHE